MASRYPAGRASRRVFAYIICINVYKARNCPTLNACVNDGKKLAAFLADKFPRQYLRIESLYNEMATYDRILSLFERASSNTSIQQGDLVIFYFAGHGSRNTAPEGWPTEDGWLEMICPYDVDTVKDGRNIYGIPDFVVGTLLRRLANKREANVVSS